MVGVAKSRKQSQIDIGIEKGGGPGKARYFEVINLLLGPEMDKDSSLFRAPVWKITGVL
jgi:hypothetical protein